MRTRLTESLAALADVFRTTDLRRLGFAYLTSVVALWAYGIAFAVYAFQIGGATLVGVSAVVRLVPGAVAAPFGAVFADRHSRRLVLIVSAAVRAALAAGACASVILGLPAIIVFVLASLDTIVSTAFEPAKNALIPDLAARPEQLTAANTTLTTFESASLFLGPALGGIVLAVSSVQMVFAMTGALLVFAALQVTRIKHRETPREPRPDSSEGGVAEVLAGFRAIASEWRMRTIVGLFAAQVLVDGLLVVITVSLAIDLLGIGQAGVGWLNSAVGIGGLIGAVVTLTLTGRSGLGGLLGIGLAGWGIPILLIGLLPHTVAALILLAVLGVANTLIDSAAFTLLQRIAPDDVRGRVFGVLEGLIIGSIAVGSVLAPVLIHLFGIRGAFIAAGAFLPALALLSAPALRRIDATTPVPTRRLELLLDIPMFAPLGPVPLEQLAAHLEAVSFGPDREIIREGDPGDRFYVIDRGEVSVVRGGEMIRREGPGGYFGEIALLRNVPRTATVRAEGEVELYALGREQFLDAVTRERVTVQAAESVVSTRLGTEPSSPAAAELDA